MLRSRLGVAFALLAVLGVTAVVAYLGGDDAPPNEPAPPPRAELPPLDPAIAALGREVHRVKAPGAIAALRQRHGAPRPSLAPDDAVDEKVRAAIDLVAKAARADAIVARAIGSALDRAGAMEVLAHDDPHGALRYDLRTGALEVPRCVADFPPDLFATAVAHELVHEADDHEIAAGLGLSTEALALLVDDLGGTPAGRLHLIDMEDRAFVVELRVAKALGVSIPAPGEVPVTPPSPGCPIHPNDLVMMLARLQTASTDPAAWRAELDRAFP